MCPYFVRILPMFYIVFSYIRTLVFLHAKSEAIYAQHRINYYLWRTLHCDPAEFFHESDTEPAHTASTRKVTFFPNGNRLVGRFSCMAEQQCPPSNVKTWLNPSTLNVIFFLWLRGRATMPSEQYENLAWSINIKGYLLPVATSTSIQRIDDRRSRFGLGICWT